MGRKRDRWRELEESRRLVQEQDDAARASCDQRALVLSSAAEKVRRLELLQQQNRQAAIGKIWLRELRKLHSIQEAEAEARAQTAGGAREGKRSSSCHALSLVDVPATVSTASSAAAASGENAVQTAACGSDPLADMPSELESGGAAASSASSMIQATVVSPAPVSAGVSDSGTAASMAMLSELEAFDADQLLAGQRVLISMCVATERLRGRVGEVCKLSKRGELYIVSVAGQKLKSPRRYLDPVPCGEELRQLASDVLYDWLPATGGWVPHEDCRESLLIDFIDAVRAVQVGEQPLPLNLELGPNLQDCLDAQDDEDDPGTFMADFVAGAYLDLPNPLCNPWQRDLLWPSACPIAKNKYRTLFQKLRDSFAAAQQSADNDPSCEPLRVQPIGAKAPTTAKAAIPETHETHCVVCLAESSERKIDWIFKECGHCCLCKPCVRKLHDAASSDLVECPLCRTASTIVPSRVYKGKVFYAN